MEPVCRNNIPEPQVAIRQARHGRWRISIQIDGRMFYLEPDEALRLADALVDTTEEVASREAR